MRWKLRGLAGGHLCLAALRLGDPRVSDVGVPTGPKLALRRSSNRSRSDGPGAIDFGRFGDLVGRKGAHLVPDRRGTCGLLYDGHMFR